MSFDEVSDVIPNFWDEDVITCINEIKSSYNNNDAETYLLPLTTLFYKRSVVALHLLLWYHDKFLRLSRNVFLHMWNIWLELGTPTTKVNLECNYTIRDLYNFPITILPPWYKHVVPIRFFANFEILVDPEQADREHLG